MSTFLGKLSEIPNISIDRFTDDNLLSKVFFLSHFHSDHMVGLRSPAMRRCLQSQENVFLYCSKITKMFLSYNHLKGLSEKVRELPLNRRHPVTVPGVGCITVTALSAGHCPGSVMFLLQFGELNILYTGDCRMTRQDVTSMVGLKDSNGNLLKIDTLYLDTTFSEPAFKYLPIRDDSMNHLIKKCQSWLDQGRNFIIDLRTPALVGVEFVLITLYKTFHQPFHVSEKMFKMYARLPDLKHAITKNGNSQFHSCVCGQSLRGPSEFIKCHPNMKNCHILSVKLCALQFRNLSPEDSIEQYKPKQNLYRIVYSSHSSHSELRDMVEVLRPSKIVPCVVRRGFTSNEIIEHLRPDFQETPGQSFSGSQSPVPLSSFDGSDHDVDEQGEQTVHLREEENHTNSPRLTLQKYNVEESSPSSDDDDDNVQVNGGADELPPFRWDCYYDARKILGYKNCEQQRLE